jgi:hypothetical protein
MPNKVLIDLNIKTEYKLIWALIKSDSFTNKL